MSRGTSEDVDERLDFVTATIDGMGWVYPRQLRRAMEAKQLVPDYALKFLYYSIHVLVDRGVLEKKDDGYGGKLYRLPPE